MYLPRDRRPRTSQRAILQPSPPPNAVHFCNGGRTITVVYEPAVECGEGQALEWRRTRAERPSGRVPRGSLPPVRPVHVVPTQRQTNVAPDMARGPLVTLPREGVASLEWTARAFRFEREASQRRSRLIQQGRLPCKASFRDAPAGAGALKRKRRSRNRGDLNPPERHKIVATQLRQSRGTAPPGKSVTLRPVGSLNPTHPTKAPLDGSVVHHSAQVEPSIAIPTHQQRRWRDAFEFPSRTTSRRIRRAGPQT